MTAGIPGAGIGGLFYIGNALWMPVREVWMALHGRSTRASRSFVMRHVVMALGIMASMWAAAWFISFSIVAVKHLNATSASGGVPTVGAVSDRPARILSYSALFVSGATLLIVLAAVQVLRFWMMYPRRARVLTCCCALILGCGLVFPARADAQTAPAPSIASQRDALLWTAPTVEEQQYREALKRDPDDSRSIFKLAQTLERRQPAESEQLYRRYIHLEPDDAWGYIVFAEYLGRNNRFTEALTLYDEAVRRAPNERDAGCGRARMLGRSGHTEAAIASYNHWLDRHPDDVEAWRELSRLEQRAGRFHSAGAALEHAYRLSPDDDVEAGLLSIRRLNAPSLEPTVGFSRDSDGNTRTRTSAGAKFSAGDGVHVGFMAGRTVVSDAANRRTFTDFTAETDWRPRAGVQINAAGGAADTDSLTPIARARLRLTAPENKTGLDLRFNRTLLDATPGLIENRVIRNEFQARPDFGITRRLHLRGNGGAGWIQSSTETNSRTAAGGGAAWSLFHNAELSGNFAQIRYAHASHSGYFAPERLQSIEAGSYMEFERDAFLVALDLGAGAERFHAHGAAFGPWRPAFRGYALLSFKLRPGREIRFEVDTYDTQASAVAAPGPGWKYASVTGSLRWAVR